MLLSLLLLGGIAYVAHRRLKEDPPRPVVSTSPATGPERPAHDDPQAIDRQIDKNLTVSASALALTTSGALVAPWLTVAAIPPLLYVTVPFIGRAYRMWQDKGKLGLALVDVVGL